MQQNNITEPGQAFELFYQDFSLSDTRRQLWELYHGWVMSGRAANTDLKLPGNLLFFYTRLEMLAEAAWLYQHQGRK